MEYWLSFFILLLSVVGSISHNCSIKDGFEDLTCVCEGEQNYWSYTCFNSRSELTIILQVNSSLSLKCENYDPPYKSIFHQVIFDRFEHLIFDSCPLPSAPLGELINYNQTFSLEEITIKGKRGTQSFTPQLFSSFDLYLKQLILSNNDIYSIEENMFYNFSSLQVLCLSENKLSLIPKGIFSKSEMLLKLDISSNILERLHDGIFENLHSLENLDLSKNRLRKLPSNIFKNLLNLQFLNISTNYLTILPDCILHGLPQIISVRLSANSFKEISEHIFNNSLNLKMVDIGLNRFIKPLPEKLFSGLPKLENITISNCNLSEIHENLFFMCPKLAYLKLDRNKLERLPDNVFQNNPLLKELNLNFNRLKELPYNLFPNQNHLRKLSVFRNHLTKIPEEIFKYARNVRVLQLSENRLQNVSPLIFQDLPNLEELKLSKNNLTNFQLCDNEYIKRIDLSFNSFSDLPNIKWSRYPNMEEFNLSNNKLRFLTIPFTEPTKKSGLTLNFSSNVIQRVEASTPISIYYKNPIKTKRDFVGYVKTEVNLANNPFVCDCNNYNFFVNYRKSSRMQKTTYFHLLSVENLVCSEPLKLAGQSIMSLSPSQFACELLEQCPFPCHCYIRAQDKANVVNCSSLHLKHLPNRVPRNTNILFFNNNMLESTGGFNSSIWENITELYLHNNRITSLEEFRAPFSLSKLTLESNLISYVPPSLMHFISRAGIFRISLSKNPWTCNCSTLRFKKWLSDNYLSITDVKEVMCPIEVNDTIPLLSTPDDILCPDRDWPYKVHLITVTMICVFLALLLIVSVLYYRNKHIIVAYVYIHIHNVFTCFFSEDDLDKDKLFDAFVSCSSSEEDVAFSILRELEKDRRFKICIAERDFIPGHPIICNILHAVYNSKRTILVISPEFLKSKWFRVEFGTAYSQMLEDKIDRLIIIVKDELPPKDTMDKDLQYILSTKTYLVWEEKWFWEKLEYAMPHKRRQALPNNEVLALEDRPRDKQILVLSSRVDKGMDKVRKAIQSHRNAVITNGRRITQN